MAQYRDNRDHNMNLVADQRTLVVGAPVLNRGHCRCARVSADLFSTYMRGVSSSCCCMYGKTNQHSPSTVLQDGVFYKIRNQDVGGVNRSNLTSASAVPAGLRAVSMIKGRLLERGMGTAPGSTAFDSLLGGRLLFPKMATDWRSSPLLLRKASISGFLEPSTFHESPAGLELCAAMPRLIDV